MEHKVNDIGFVRLVDTMPREDLDGSIVQAARVSYGDGTKSSRSNKGLIRYLLRHWHTTPFEMVEFKFHLKMPIFVARQHLRHRMASVNEMSARYSVVPNEFFVPQEYRKQSQVSIRDVHSCCPKRHLPRYGDATCQVLLILAVWTNSETDLPVRGPRILAYL